jgi:hypothetical protein
LVIATSHSCMVDTSEHLRTSADPQASTGWPKASCRLGP